MNEELQENFCFFIDHLATIDEFETFLENVKLNFDRMARKPVYDVGSWWF